MHGISTVGVDIGGTWIRAGGMDSRGDVVRRVREPLQSRLPEDVAAQLQRLLRELECGEEVPLGVTLPGDLDPVSGFVRCAPNLGWRDLPFKHLLEDTLGRVVWVVNDLNAITYGEWRRGAGKGCEDLLCVYVGTGVGMGIISNGALLGGAKGGAGELGHVKVERAVDARLCGCGERGCLEAYVSGAHLGVIYSELSGERSSAKSSAEFLEGRVRGGDTVAVGLWERCADYLTEAVANAAMILDPERVVLGGGVLRSAPRLMSRLESQLATGLRRGGTESVRVLPSLTGECAGIIGAGLLALGDQRPLERP